VLVVLNQTFCFQNDDMRFDQSSLIVLAWMVGFFATVETVLSLLSLSLLLLLFCCC
tara:strand:- start:177 stop:344 length:168 start_codon:yes stop_codon:yes gene_type:complete